ncbi:MAG TPA: amidohydrolase family protein [Verrucomicrobiota bacterium]|nr:amidohydrolase family protein [Verrucomicrobiota bacterium]
MKDESGVNRRTFIKSFGVAGLCLTGAGMPMPIEAAASSKAEGLVDVNVTLMRWPMRRLRLDDPEKLAQALRKKGVTEAWACTFEALLERDLAAANERLSRVCKSVGGGLFVPFGAVNPAQPWWREDVQRCQEKHRMAGIRLYPGYHGYNVDDANCTELLRECASRNLIVQIVATVEDVRVQQPRMKAAPVDLKPLSGILASEPALKLVLLNWNRSLSAKLAAPLVSSGRVWVDIATQETVGGVESLLQQVPARAVVFGSHCPYYYFESALLKLRESEIKPGDLARIRRLNAAAISAHKNQTTDCH